ncbi:hypothetical protein JCM10295v2_006382 [Rhodotorula toruloides]
MDEWRMEGGDAKAGGAAVKSEPGEEAKAATGTKQEKRASENTAGFEVEGTLPPGSSSRGL